MLWDSTATLVSRYFNGVSMRVMTHAWLFSCVRVDAVFRVASYPARFLMVAGGP